MDYNNLKFNYEAAFEIYKHSERLKDSLIKSIIDSFVIMLEEECSKRNLVFIEMLPLNKNDIIDYFCVNISGIIVRIDFASSKKNQHKKIKSVLNKVRNIIYPMVAIAGTEYNKAMSMNLIKLTIGNIGYIKSIDYYSKIKST